ncbi:polymorphic toxin-type HINT domain-containing protein [Brevibacillus dissolubilis]|uniref:polymorphic toxin-type HINT domain-containing protein n=1 Tax=Brevibacillus dissolubilis TaxID=1844116 RepID=UPI001C3F2A86|nr:polymorphic toxin-type HINT domain-containing protein [Brevibacillus dissolubilis]
MSKGAKELPGSVAKAGKELLGAVKKAGVEHIGKENVKTLTDGKWNQQDVRAAGSAAVNVAPAGKLGKAVKAGAKTTAKTVSKTKAATKTSTNVAKKCNCFTAGTIVLTNKGEKSIEEIKVGDKVLAKDVETGEMAYKEVEWLFQREVEETYNITVGEEVITTTDEHPFWIVGKGWVESRKLVVGDVLTTSDGKILAIKKIVVKKEHRTVYNFKVKDFHTYFVSNLGIWTHNRCSWITSGSLSREEETAVLNTLRHIDSGTRPGGQLNRKWGTTFGNYQGHLPIEQRGVYKEYRVSPPPGSNGAGERRIVANTRTGEMYYTWSHYGDNGVPFVRIR